MKIPRRTASAVTPTTEALPEPDVRPGPHDQALLDAQDAVTRAEAVLITARDHRARVMIDALEDGYSVYLLGILTGRRRPSSIYRDLRRFDTPTHD